MSNNHSLNNPFTDQPDWIYQVIDDPTDSTQRSALVFTLTNLINTTNTSLNKLLLINSGGYQWYHDVTQEEPALAATNVPASAPSVIHGVDGRIWKAIGSYWDDGGFIENDGGFIGNEEICP